MVKTAKGFRWALLPVILLFMQLAVAADKNEPKAILQSTTNEMIKQLSAHKDKINDQIFVEKLAREILVPKADFVQMARRVIGATWRKASGSQRKDFTEAFETLVVRTYAAAFKAYKDQTVDIISERYSPSNRKLVEIKTAVNQSDAPTIDIYYRMRLAEDGWKVYDMTVEGVSLVRSYRSQFVPIIRKSGFQGLITEIQNRNTAELTEK